MGLRARFHCLSLCTGVAGLDLGLKRAVPHARVVCLVEREGYCCEVLASRMREGRLDDCPIWADIESFDGRPWRGFVDCVIGGYPCPGESLAGKGLGTADPRWLWPEFARIISEVRPEWCFFENVSGHLSRSFRHVRSDLQGMGYTVAAGLFEASEVGSPQKRERVFILAHARSPQWGLSEVRGSGYSQGHDGERQAPDRLSERGDVLADAECEGHQGFIGDRETGTERTSRRQSFQCNAPLVHPSGQPQREPADAGQPVPAGGRARDEPGDPGEQVRILGDAERCRREGRNATGQQGKEGFEARYPGIPEFPPGPGDVDSWRSILAIRPDLAPAVGKPGKRLARLAQRYLEARTEEERQSFEPRVRRVAARLSGRVDRLRALGNAVVPAQAEYAFRELYAALTLPKEELPPKQVTMFDI